MKRLFSALLIVVLLVILLSVSVAANSPAPAPYYVFSVKNLPAGTAYVDMLIPLPSSDEHYVPLVKENLPEGFTEQSEIVTYSEGEYRSYTFHYNGAESAICLNGGETVRFFTKETVSYDYTLTEHLNDVEMRGKIRLAMLDEDGNILKVSGILSLKPKGLFKNSLNTFDYDAAADILDVDSHSYAPMMILLGIVIAAGIAATCLIEWAVSKCFFRTRPYGKLVVITNVITQVVMWLLILLLWNVLHWNVLYATILLEILVYVTEFLIYRRKMRAADWKMCLLYTVLANTASVILGPLLVAIVVVVIL